jgi:hypothetical protein
MRKAIRLPDDVRQKAIELKGQEAACAETK